MVALRPVVLVLVAFLIVPVTNPVMAEDVPALGAAFIAAEEEWHDYHVPVFQAGGFTAAKVQIPAGYWTNPEDVEQLIDAGATVVIFRTDNCESSPRKVRSDFEGRGFAGLLDRYPAVDFYIEVGNEPDNFCQHWSPETYRDNLITIHDALARGFPDLGWIASLCAHQACSDRVLADGRILDRYDGLGIHLYGHYQFDDAPENGNWTQFQVYRERYRDVPLFMTELGINDASMPDTDKARIYRAFVDSYGAEFEAILFWTISTHPEYANYRLTSEMARIISPSRDRQLFLPDGG